MPIARAGGYRTRDFAADVSDFLDAVGLDSAIIVGHSMGATNAERFAIDLPRRASGLVLAGMFASYRNNAGLVEYWQTAVSRLRDPIDLDSSASSRRARSPSPYRRRSRARRDESLKVPARVWRDTFARPDRGRFAAELGAIEAPTLLVWGDRDAFAPRGDRTRAYRHPDARLIVYEGTGHAVHWEQPARFAADLVAFVAFVAVDKGAEVDVPVFP